MSVLILDMHPDMEGVPHELQAILTALYSRWQDLLFINTEAANVGGEVLVHGWQREGSASDRIRLFEDRKANIRWIVVAVDAADCEERIVTYLGRQLPVYDQQALRRAAAAGTDPRALVMLGLGDYAGADAEVVEIIAAALRSASVPMRVAAASAAVFLKWPALVPPLSAAAEAESEAPIKKLLAVALRDAKKSAVI